MPAKKNITVKFIRQKVFNIENKWPDGYGRHKASCKQRSSVAVNQVAFITQFLSCKTLLHIHGKFTENIKGHGLRYWGIIGRHLN